MGAASKCTASKCACRCFCSICCLVAVLPELYLFGVVGYFFAKVPPIEKFDTDIPMVIRPNASKVMWPNSCQAVCHPEERLEESATAHIYAPGACECTHETKSFGAMTCETSAELDWRIEPAPTCLANIHSELVRCDIPAIGMKECPKEIDSHMFNPIAVKTSLITQSIWRLGQILAERPTAQLSQQEAHIVVPAIPTLYLNETIAFQEVNMSINLAEVAVWAMFGNNKLLRDLKTLEVGASLPKDFEKVDVQITGANGQPAQVPLGGYARGTIGITVEQTLMGGRRRATKDWAPKLRIIEFEATVHAQASASASATVEGLTFNESIDENNEPLIAVHIKRMKIQPNLDMVSGKTKVVEFIVPACTVLGVNMCNMARPAIESLLTSAVNAEMHKIEADVGNLLVTQMGDKGIPVKPWSAHAVCFLLFGCDGKGVDDVAKQGLMLYYAAIVYNLFLVFLMCGCCCWCICGCCCGDGEQEEEDDGDQKIEVVVTDDSLDLSNLDSELFRGDTFETAKATER